MARLVDDNLYQKNRIKAKSQKTKETHHLDKRSILPHYSVHKKHDHKTCCRPDKHV